MSDGNFDRLADLVRRDLGAVAVRLVDDGDAFDPARALACRLPDGRMLVAEFEVRPEAADALTRRLEMLVESFADLVDRPRASRTPPPVSLGDELRSLSFRAGASDALVIDATSPIVWAASDAAMSLSARYDTDVIDLPERDEARPRRLPGVPCDVSDLGVEPLPPHPPSAAEDRSIRAIGEVRALPAIGSLARGGHMHHVTRGDDFGWIARSFASIYVLILVFPAPFDELRAERAVSAALPVVERLVLSLPPLDPKPFSGARGARKRG